MERGHAEYSVHIQKALCEDEQRHNAKGAGSGSPPGGLTQCPVAHQKHSDALRTPVSNTSVFDRKLEVLFKSILKASEPAWCVMRHCMRLRELKVSGGPLQFWGAAICSLALGWHTDQGHNWEQGHPSSHLTAWLAAVQRAEGARRV